MTRSHLHHMDQVDTDMLRYANDDCAEAHQRDDAPAYVWGEVVTGIMLGFLAGMLATAGLAYAIGLFL